MKILLQLVLTLLGVHALQAQIGYTDINYIAISPDGKKVAYSGGQKANHLTVIDEQKKIIHEKQYGSGYKLQFIDNDHILINKTYSYNLKTEQYKLQAAASQRLNKAKLLVQTSPIAIQLQSLQAIPLANFYFYDDSLRYEKDTTFGKSNIVNYLDGGKQSRLVYVIDDHDNHKYVNWSNPSKNCDHASLYNTLGIHPEETHLITAVSKNHAALISLKDLEIKNFSTHFNNGEEPIIGAVFSPKGDRIILHNYHQLEIFDLQNLEQSRRSKALPPRSSFQWIVLNEEEILGVHLDKVFSWDYEAELQTEFSLQGKLIFVHPKHYIFSHDKTKQIIYCYNSNGKLIKEYKDCMFPAAMLMHQSHILQDELDKKILSQDGTKLICLDAQNPQEIKFIDLSQLK